ncbi:uncharacterized protein LOC122935876 isoform X4 [Bufo gargarizans]|uniref:uncharacterized protein LOC122935876 isoform X4 n=1 Tax=Bufo gargarizans TaxID=30331 RepID=UPI001CF1C940|nr:uncharacterized protein LOC122935876 isoform X4 [Bufo gargarizans]
MMGEHQPLTSPGSDYSRRSPPERCPRPLYSQDCPEEKLPENHQALTPVGEIPPRDVPVLCIPRTVERRSSQRTIRLRLKMKKKRRRIYGAISRVLTPEKSPREMSPSSVFLGLSRGEAPREPSEFILGS